jgi:tetratricopeptide (TPR) repeat protein
MLRTPLLALTVLGAGSLHAQYSNGRQSVILKMPTASQRAVTSQRIGMTDITVTYSRPLAGKRKIWGDTVKYGEVWRAGANENTVFEITDAVSIEGRLLAAGKYGLHMIPGQDSWTIIFSKESAAWGSFTYDEKEDALRVTVKPKTSEFHDALVYEFGDPKPDAVELLMRWEKVAVPMQIAVDVNTVTETALKRQLRDLIGYSWQAWDDAAEFLLDKKHNLELALKWADQSVQYQPQFHNQQTKARILTALGKKDEAATVMNAALKMAGPIQIYNYGRQLQFEGKHAEAIPVFRETAKRHPDQWIGHLALARVLSSEKKFAEALKEAKASMEGAPPVQKPQIEGYVAKLEKGQDINQ